MHDPLNGAKVDPASSASNSGGLVLPKYEPTTDVVALTVPNGSTFSVACTLFVPDDDRTLAVARVTALKIGSITG